MFDLTGMVKVDGDTSGGVNALKKLGKEQENATKSGNTMSQGVENLGKKILTAGGIVAGLSAGVAVLTSSYNDWMTAQKASADLFSQLGNNAWIAASDINKLRVAVDDMIKIQTLAKGYNALVKGDLKANLNDVANLGRAAVQIGRQTGEQADDVFQKLQQAVLSGKGKALAEYGILVDEQNLEINAHISAMEKQGKAATERDLRLAKSNLIMDQVTRKYRDQTIAATDINEIESKYKNERAANAALSAKLSEDQAKQIQSLKHGWNDFFLNFKSGINGLIYDTKKLKAVIDGLATKELTNYAEGFEYQIMEQYGVDWKNALSYADQLSTLKTKMQDEDRLALMSQEHLNKLSLDTLEQVRSGNQEKAERNKLQLESAMMLQNQYSEIARVTDLQLANKAKYTDKELAVAEKRNAEAKAILANLRDQVPLLESIGQKLEQNQGIVANAKLFQLAEGQIQGLSKSIIEVSKALGESQTKARETFLTTSKEIEKIQKNGKDLSDTDRTYLQDKTGNLLKQLDVYQKQNQTIDEQLKPIEDIQKLGGKLNADQESTLAILQAQKKEIEAQQNPLKSLVLSAKELLFGFKASTTTAVGAKGAVAAWYTELQKVKKALKGGLDEGVSAKYGTTDVKQIEKQLKAKNNTQLQFEKELADSVLKIQEERAKREMEIEAERKKTYEEDLAEETRLRKEVYDLEEKQIKDGLEKEWNYTEEIARIRQVAQLQANDDLKSKKKLTTLELAEKESKINQLREQIDRLKDLQKEETDLPTLEARNKNIVDLETQLVDGEKFVIEKRINQKKEEANKLKAINTELTSFMKNQGEALLRATGESVWEAMTISDQALKESGKTRKQMLQEALKDEAEKIAKNAFLESIFAGAKSVGSYAVGDAVSGSRYAAAALAYAGVAATAYGISKAIPSGSSKGSGGSSSSSGSGKDTPIVAGTTKSDQPLTVVINFPQGFVVGDKTSVARFINETVVDAQKRRKI